MTGSQRTSIAETSSISSGPQEKEDTHSSTQALSCLNFGWIFRWLRHQVLPSFWGREHPKKATESPHQLAQKKRLSHRRESNLKNPSNWATPYRQIFKLFDSPYSTIPMSYFFPNKQNTYSCYPCLPLPAQDAGSG